MNAVVDQALVLWGMADARYTLAAARENAVYRVEANRQQFALRLHRKGYRNDAQLRAELHWMAACADGGLRVPTPVEAPTGHRLHHVAGVQVDVVRWLDGAPLSDSFATLPAARRAGIMHDLGQQMAKLHTLSDAWAPPADFSRPTWDASGLLGAAPLWDRFWDNPALTPPEREQMRRFRSHAHAALADATDFGLIHADLVAGNVMIHAGALALIDFDDGGYGYRLFDVATALGKYSADPDFTALQAALLEGYRSTRALDTTLLDLFLALRACTYVGWNITRTDEDPHRNARFIREATRAVTRVMAEL